MRRHPTITPPDEEEVVVVVVRRFGYRPRLARTLGRGEAFGVAFSFISVTTGIFTTFGFLLATAGPRGIWTWPIAVAGQTLVALVYAALAARMPLAGGPYQWACRLAGPAVGWWTGWLSLAFLVIVTASVDYALIQAALYPLAGVATTPPNLAAGTLVVLATQASLLCWSTPVTARLNNLAVLAEIIGLLQLTIVLLVAGRIAGIGQWNNLLSTGVVPAAGWWSWLGPGMLATLLGAYTIVGFEASAVLAEETRQPRRVVPAAMVQAVVVSGVLGMVFLVALTQAIRYSDRLDGSAAPVAAILRAFLGGRIELFLAFICLAVYACGTVIMATASRLAWAMARDGRLPAHQLLARVPRAKAGPVFSVLLVAGASALIVVTLSGNLDALTTLFTASTLLPAVAYAGMVGLFAWPARRALPMEPAVFRLGIWERPVVVGALGWLGYELVILLAPAQFRPAQTYASAAVALGAVVYLLMRAMEPVAMTRQPDPVDTLSQDPASLPDEPPW
jgi:amino acid transporter